MNKAAFFKKETLLTNRKDLNLRKKLNVLHLGLELYSCGAGTWTRESRSEIL